MSSHEGEAEHVHVVTEPTFCVWRASTLPRRSHCRILLFCACNSTTLQLHNLSRQSARRRFSGLCLTVVCCSRSRSRCLSARCACASGTASSRCARTEATRVPSCTAPCNHQCVSSFPKSHGQLDSDCQTQRLSHKNSKTDIFHKASAKVDATTMLYTH